MRRTGKIQWFSRKKTMKGNRAQECGEYERIIPKRDPILVRKNMQLPFCTACAESTDLPDTTKIVISKKNKRRKTIKEEQQKKCCCQAMMLTACGGAIHNRKTTAAKPGSRALSSSSAEEETKAFSGNAQKLVLSTYGLSKVFSRRRGLHTV